MKLARTILSVWPDIHPNPKRTILLFGDRLQFSRHFPGVRSWSIDVLTERGLLCVSTSGIISLGFASFTHCPEHRTRQVNAMEKARA